MGRWGGGEAGTLAEVPRGRQAAHVKDASFPTRSALQAADHKRPTWVSEKEAGGVKKEKMNTANKKICLK